DVTVAVLRVTNPPVAQEFDEIFNEHYALVYRTAYGVTGNTQDAEDVVQILFLRLFRRGFPAGFRENPRAYLYRAAVNVSLNMIRSGRRHIFAANAEQLEAPVDSGRPNPDSPIQGRLVKAFAKLNSRAIEMLILRYEHHYTEAEIAKLLGTSRGVVAVTLFRARRK